MQNHIQRCADAAEKRIDFLLEEEQEPFTMNEQNFMDYRSKFLAHYKGIRQRTGSQSIFTLDSLKLDGNQHDTRSAQPRKNTPPQAVAAAAVDSGSPDSMESAIQIMAEVRAYFQGS
jgi:hypothetical protein